MDGHPANCGLLKVPPRGSEAALGRRTPCVAPGTKAVFPLNSGAHADLAECEHRRHGLVNLLLLGGRESAKTLCEPLAINGAKAFDEHSRRLSL